jgi:hypothetical protein
MKCSLPMSIFDEGVGKDGLWEVCQLKPHIIEKKHRDQQRERKEEERPLQTKAMERSFLRECA